MKAIMIPLPKGFDMSAHKEGETFDITASVTMTKHGLEVEAIEGMPVEKDESPHEEKMEDEGDTEMDEEGFGKAMDMVRGKKMEEEE